MKRSEAIARLHWYMPIESQFSKSDCDRLLDFIESALAMRPESYQGLVATGKRYNPETDQGRDKQMFNDWEPEDV
jgi:hypothetical protein